MKRIFFFIIAALMAACAPAEPKPVRAAAPAVTATAIFAGGCFWCAEHDLQAVPGVIDVVSGYTGGTLANPRYEDVITETTGHYEAVRVTYDPAKITYRALVDRFFRLVDPTDGGGQFCDRGPSYRAAVFVTPAQKADAEGSKAAVAAQLKRPVATEIVPISTFYLAEDYHQDYSEKNPVRYRLYRTGCGRDARLRDVWGAAR